MKKHVTVRHEWELSAGMELLRATVLGCEPRSTRDPFDTLSSHVVAYADGEPVGMVRVTSSAPSPLAHWARGAWSLPTGSDVVELTRGVVDEDWRRHGVYRLLMLEAMAALSPEVVRIATAAIEPDFVGRRFLESLGFHSSGDGQLICDDPRKTFVVPILTPVDAAQLGLWQRMLADWRRKLDQSGVAVSGRAGHVDPYPVAKLDCASSRIENELMNLEIDAATSSSPASERPTARFPGSGESSGMPQSKNI